MRNRSRFIAGALAVVMTISGLPLADIKAAESENFVDAKELSLSFEDALTDASSNQIAVTASKAVSYVEDFPKRICTKRNNGKRLIVI